MSLRITSTCSDALKRSRYRSLASSRTKLSVSGSAYRIGIGCAGCYLLSLPAAATAQPVGDEGHPETTLTFGTNSGTSPQFNWEYFWTVFGCSIMIIIGGVRLAAKAWRTNHRNRLHNHDPAQGTSKFLSLSLFTAFTAASSIGCAAVALTVGASDNFFYLVFAVWCMCSMFYMSEPFPGVSPQDRKFFLRFSLGGPAVISFLVHHLLNGIDREKLGYLAMVFTAWWIALDIFTYTGHRPQSVQSCREHDGILGQDTSRPPVTGAHTNGDAAGSSSTLTAWWNALDFSTCFGLLSLPTNGGEDVNAGQDGQELENWPHPSGTTVNDNRGRTNHTTTNQQPTTNGPTPAYHRRSDEPTIDPEQVDTATGIQDPANNQSGRNEQIQSNSYPDAQAMQDAATVYDAAGQISGAYSETG